MPNKTQSTRTGALLILSAGVMSATTMFMLFYAAWAYTFGVN